MLFVIINVLKRLTSIITMGVIRFTHLAYNQSSFKIVSSVISVQISGSIKNISIT